ncbi:uncharacterized protein PITG_06548 [Phytophthora infestans T30-4]|uniref:Uncharacterized protein n=1 Tax=Phytophthora infestans (strain T30-4) TaxID=403677 RepID=D0N536_PHYIT|nr:uncharacterized protein PITG_06548 [Phytophthora infestans T30-4]EEY69994.1 conserved hypothetical protein [Phytophthora infestans T30-4]|eukprot:XP_002998641.1 conserved hypothetical protein [Phytophthora infestans T30-4]
MALNDHDTAPSPPERILSLLGLEKSSIADELRLMVSSRFRQPQQAQLADTLSAMQPTPALSNVASWFSYQFDPTDDVEYYLQDLTRMHHYIAAHDRQRPLRSRHLDSSESAADGAVTRQLLHFYASFADSRDRHLLTKIYQTLGLSRAITYCVVAKTLPFKVQKEFLDLFADDLPELREWISWLDELEHAAVKVEGDMACRPGYESAVNFVSRAIKEHCMLTWLGLLRPLDSMKRLSLIDAIHRLLAASNTSGFLPTTTSTLKKLGRFYETTGISAAKLLDLDVAVRCELSFLLEEFPTIILITLFTKFNSEKMIHLVVKRGLPYFPKNDLLKMLDALAPAEINAIEVFVTTLFAFGRKKADFLLRFLTFSPPSQLRFLDLMITASSSPLNADTSSYEEDPEDAFAIPALTTGNNFLMKFFLYAGLKSPDLVIQKLSSLPTEMIHQILYTIAVHSAEDLAVLGRGLETVELPCLQPFLRLFLAIPLGWREVLVPLVEEMPGEEAQPLYDTLLHLQATCEDKVTTVLQMLGALHKKDKTILCRDIQSHHEAQLEGHSSSIGIHAKVLLYLCECDLARHKVLRLLRTIPFDKYDSLLYFLRTQRMPEQVALTRLMLSMPSGANCRLLAKMSAWPLEALDAFFQLLLMLAKVEYKMFAKLMGSQYVSAEQLQVFITVAVDMMNQASSRELVIFAAGLPVHIRDLFFEMLTDRPEKGVLLRIIGYSTRVPPELMHLLIAIFHRMSWEIRSAFIEQLRALEGVSNVENLAEVASNLQDNEALRLLILLLSPLQIHIRVSLVALFLQLNVQARTRLLARLVKMPKNSVGAFCTAICSSSCEPVSASFCRVIGLVDARYHTSLLRLLASEPLWFFLRLMAEHCDVEQRLEQSTELLNQVAKTVCLFSLDDNLLLLKDVIREALGDAMPLSDTVAVLALFPEVSKLLDFLRYVMGFAKCARTSLIFRVLAKYQQPEFIFEMCRILDLDDAIFALKRLDRTWQRRHEELDRAMESLCRLVQVKDDFCDLIVGFKSLSALDVDRPLRLPSATPPSHQPVALNRHLQRTRPGQAFFRKRTERKAWWQDLDDVSCLFLPSDRQSEASPEPPVISSVTSHPHANQHSDTCLNRSESAPTTLSYENDSQWSKQKRSRGVAAALNRPLDFHVGRDKGADFLQRQRERVYHEKGASSIRHARTSAAQDNVMEARVCRALGKRVPTSQTILSPLSRPDSQTVENAVSMLAKAAQLRDSSPQGFVSEAPKRNQTPAKHHMRMLPSNPKNPSIKAETELNCEPVAPW